jgi:hypothetical protein
MTKRPSYSGFRISVAQERTRKRSLWRCPALTSPSPEGRGGIVLTLEEAMQENHAQRRLTREMLDQWRKDGT